MRRKFIDTLCDFPAFLKEHRKKKGEKKCHCAVDESYSFVNRARLPLLCEKSGAMLLVLVGLMVGWLIGSEMKYW